MSRTSSARLMYVQFTSCVYWVAIANSKSKAVLSHLKRAENNYRSQLGEEPLSSLMRNVLDGKPYPEHDSTRAVEDFLQ